MDRAGQAVSALVPAQLAGALGRMAPEPVAAFQSAMTGALSPLPDVRGVPLGELDADTLREVLKRILPEDPAVPVAAFNSAI